MRDLQVAAVAPAAPAIAWGLLDLLLVVSFVVLWGLLHGWNKTFGAVLVRLANVTILTRKPLGFLGKLNAEIVDGLGKAVAATEHAMVYSFHQLVGSLEWMGQSIAGLAVDTYNAIASTSTTITNRVTKVVNQTVVKPITKTVRVTSAVTATQFRHLTTRVRALEARVAHAVTAAGHAIANPFPRIKRAERDLSNLAKRLRKAEKALAAGASVALLVAALARLGLGWLRCPSLTRAMKKRKCYDFDWLNAVLDAGLLVASLVSLQQMARELEEPTALVRDGMRDLIRELR